MQYTWVNDADGSRTQKVKIRIHLNAVRLALTLETFEIHKIYLHHGHCDKSSFNTVYDIDIVHVMIDKNLKRKLISIEK